MLETQPSVVICVRLNTWSSSAVCSCRPVTPAILRLTREITGSSCSESHALRKIKRTVTLGTALDCDDSLRGSDFCLFVSYRVGNRKSIQIPESDTSCKILISIPPINSCVHIFFRWWKGPAKKCICLWIIHSKDSFKNTDSSSNESSQSWVSHWIIPFRNYKGFCLVV